MYKNFYAFILIFIVNNALADAQLCEHIIFREGSLSLNQNERVLVCGKEDAPEGWTKIPLPQSEYHIRVFLEREGYLTPRFEREKDKLFVWRGERTYIKELEVKGAEEILDTSKKRKIKGSALTSEKLDETTMWGDTFLRSRGYACPKLESQAQLWDKKIILNAVPDKRQKVSKTDYSSISEIDESAILRYQAFRDGEYYDVRKTQLTISRMLSDGLVQSAYFTTECDGDYVNLKLFGDTGPSRMLSFEVGASTEEFPFANLTFKNNRIDDLASSYSLSLHASPILQSLMGTYSLYILPWSKRNFLGPRFRVARVSEKAYEYVEGKVGVDMGRLWDLWDIRWNARFGPTANYVRTAQGMGPEDVSYLSWDGSVQVASHEYEASLRNQYEGWNASFNYRGQREGLGSKIDVNRYDFDYKLLWNIGGYYPPLFVLGFRMELDTVQTDSNISGSSKEVLPIDYRIFYGGADNLRGFSRKSLDNSEMGYLTAAYMGLELRLIEELPWKLEPFLLFDIAQLGKEKYKLDDPLFTSAGLGLRWVSPFGALRGSAAMGEIYQQDDSTKGYEQEWVYFLSFGQEF